MKIMTIQVPDDSVDFVEKFVERIGGSVETKAKEKKESKRVQVRKYKPLDFFGTWSDIDLDPKIYRKQLWRKAPELE
ncbi:hypothetical protein FC093_04155 [Ilyomonas limi]|uniref:Uncharacterized protein n=1 Tax=Ilyomonas limi TaxID=2575867 RepID=A0A4U3L6M6_9BACT|nr:hypothetical protein [Ilyomonas limi]TKK70895.1 hypothetical protein FC093_04155 [Ilyomonas limi]